MFMDYALCDLHDMYYNYEKFIIKLTVNIFTTIYVFGGAS